MCYGIGGKMQSLVCLVYLQHTYIYLHIISNIFARLQKREILGKPKEIERRGRYKLRRKWMVGD
jgi:hypothetical protein